MAATVLMQLTGLDAWYGDKQVLHGIDVTLPVRGCTALLGPSGTGKSTLMRCIDAFSQTQERQLQEGSWRASYQQGNVSHAPLLRMRVQQKAQRPSGMTGLQFFVDGQAESAASVMQSLRELFAQLQEVDLLTRLFASVTELSDVEWVLFCILRAAQRASDLLMLDEPTAGLSDADAMRVVALITRLAQTRAIVIITHHVQQARALAQHVVLLGNGRVVEAGPAGQFFAAPRTAAGQHYLANGTLPERSESGDGESALTACLIEETIETLSAGRVPRNGKINPLLPARFRWVVPDRLAGVSIPGLLREARQDLAGLQGAGIDTLLNLTETPFDRELAAEFGIDCLFMPIPDMTPPTLAQAVDLCALLDKQMAQGRCVAVHCKAGQGRTGTVLALYLMWRAKGQWSGEDSVKAMRRIDPGWIQSASQEVFLSAFEQFIRRNVTFT